MPTIILKKWGKNYIMDYFIIQPILNLEATENCDEENKAAHPFLVLALGVLHLTFSCALAVCSGPLFELFTVELHRRENKCAAQWASRNRRAHC